MNQRNRTGVSKPPPANARPPHPAPTTPPTPPRCAPRARCGWRRERAVPFSPWPALTQRCAPMRSHHGDLACKWMINITTGDFLGKSASLQATAPSPIDRRAQRVLVAPASQGSLFFYCTECACANADSLLYGHISRISFPRRRQRKCALAEILSPATALAGIIAMCRQVTP